ncbi:MAG: FISUMP domain-containing protein, partial [Flavobacteriales bacterium]
LQELAEGYQVLLDHTADQDSIILALSAELDTCDGTIPVPAGNSADGPCLGQDFVTYQGHDYGIIEIGNQCWLSENLNVTEFRDGTPIQHLQGTTEWLTTDAAGWCYPEDTQGNALAELGRLYNFWVVGNNICPSGWRIPSFAEWFQNDNLKPWFEAQAPEYAGMTGAALKVPGTESWNAPNAWANNQLGFNGLPTGSRNLDGEFSEPGSIATYHINNTFGGGEAHHTVLSSSSTDLYRISPWRGDTPETWHMGTAIRCIKN